MYEGGGDKRIIQIIHIYNVEMHYKIHVLDRNMTFIIIIFFFNDICV